MQMDIGLDTGAMILQRTCEIHPQETGQTLHDKLANLGAQLLTETLDEIENLPVTRQDDQQATYAKKLDKAEAQLNWQEPATVLERQVRAFNPWPIAQAQLFNQTLRIWEAQALPALSTITKPVGSILACQRHGIDIVTAEGILRLLKIQQAGGKPLSVNDFLNGHPQYLDLR
jgi:methionyl-tRNA formyltransferase